MQKMVIAGIHSFLCSMVGFSVGYRDGISRVTLDGQFDVSTQ